MRITKGQFVTALKVLGEAPGRVPKVLQAHYEAPGRVATMSYLATSAGYVNWKPVNVQYGLLARRIAETLRVPLPDTRLTLLADFVERKAQSNEHWQIVMKPEFAAALKDVGWV